MNAESTYEEFAKIAKKIIEDYKKYYSYRKQGIKNASRIPRELHYLTKSYVKSVIIGLGNSPKYSDLKKQLGDIEDKVFTYKDFLEEVDKCQELNEGWKDLAASALLGLATLKGAGADAKAADVVNKPTMTAYADVAKNILKGSEIALLNKNTYDYISHWEGKSNKVYIDTAGKPTIGVGHYLKDDIRDRELFEKLFDKKVDYDAILSGKQTLTDDQIEKLFNADIKIKEKSAENIITGFKNFPMYVKNAIINALYRGDMGPKTIKLINSGDWNLVPIEYLNHQNAKSGKEQIKRRMQTNAYAFLNYSKQMKEYFGFNYYF